MRVDFERHLNKKENVLNQFFHPSRVLIEGCKDLLKMWVEAVETGKLQATPEEVVKTRNSIKEYENALIGPLPPRDIRSN